MGSDLGFVEYVVDQLADDCGVTYKKMFGEFGLYSHGKLFGLVCDDQLFIKATAAGRAHVGDPEEAPPYPGAKGKEIYETVSQQAWSEWQAHQTMLINEKHLNLASGEDRKYLQQQMDLFLNNEKFDRAEGYVPE